MLPPGSSVQRAPSSLEVDLKDNLNAAEGHFRLSASVNLSIFSAVISREMWIVRYKALRAQLQKIHHEKKFGNWWGGGCKISDVR